ncbi:MAG: lysine--tRNA ligase [Nitrospirae bacterium GWC2_57_9]|nr:MAG: lysine--tRNA ligase [Nitrospirae bacterium GWC2_57_9]
MEDYNELIQQRFKKLGEVCAMGVKPYAGRFPVADSAQVLAEKYGNTGKEELEQVKVRVTVAGRVIAMRSFGKACFCHIQDGSGRIQLYFQKNTLGEDQYALFKKLDIGDFIGARGFLFRTKTNELTIDAEDFTLLAKSLRPLPEKWHGLTDVELRYRQRYVDLIVNPEVKKVFLMRTMIVQAIRGFLNSRGYLEVETPMMQSIPGGATAKPFKTHHNALDMDLYLRIAPELYLKRLLVGGFERVYEINRNFRNEGISTRHNPEFTMLEFYTAYADYRDLITMTEEMISTVARDVLGTLKVGFEGHEIDLTPPWKRISYRDSLREAGVPEEVLVDAGKAREYALNKGASLKGGEPLGKLLNEIFEALVEPHLIQPTFITDYPTDISPLSKRCDDDPASVERFELFVVGRELANAFSELNDPVDQKERFLKQVGEREAGDEEAHQMDEDFIRALEYGMPPAAGEGIGIDRLVMLLTGSSSIRDVILFPQMKKEK